MWVSLYDGDRVIFIIISMNGAECSIHYTMIVGWQDKGLNPKWSAAVMCSNSL